MKILTKNLRMLDMTIDKFEVGKKYISSNVGPSVLYECIFVTPSGNSAVMIWANGETVATIKSVWTEHKEKQKGTVYLNILLSPSGEAFGNSNPSREKALTNVEYFKRYGYTVLVAAKPVKWEEE